MDTIWITEEGDVEDHADSNIKMDAISIDGSSHDQDSNNDERSNSPIEMIGDSQLPYPEDDLMCQICFKIFKTKKLLKRHSSVHSDARPFKCSLCNATFRLKSYIGEHMVTHTDSKPFSCSECSMHFKTKKSLTKHKLVHSDIKPYKCTLCNSGFKRKDDLKNHTFHHFDAKPHRCSGCDFKFGTKSGLRRHRMLCPFAKIPGQSLNDVRISIENELKKMFPSISITEAVTNIPITSIPNISGISPENSGIKDFPGILREKTEIFRENTGILREKTEIPNIPIPSFECSVCNEVYMSEESLLIHEKTHEVGNLQDDYFCGEIKCDVDIVEYPDMEINYGGLHNELPEEESKDCDILNEEIISEIEHHFSNMGEHKCPICHRILANKKSLLRHITIHSDKRPYKCTLCDAKFRLKSYVQSHMLSHTDLKPFNCPQCDVKFKTKKSLRKHMIIHSNIKPFHCEECSCRFKRKTELNTHMFTHYDTKPFGCNICHMEFTTRQNWRKHLAVHNNFKPFKCSVCGSQSRRRDHMKKHLRTHSTFGVVIEIEQEC